MRDGQSCEHRLHADLERPQPLAEVAIRVEGGGVLEVGPLDDLLVRAGIDAEQRVVVALIEVAERVEDPPAQIGLEVDVLDEGRLLLGAQRASCRQRLPRLSKRRRGLGLRRRLRGRDVRLGRGSRAWPAAEAPRASASALREG